MNPPLFGDPRLDEIYRYWLSKRRGDTLPRRTDIRPSELGQTVRNLNLIDVVRDPEAKGLIRFRHRLVGTAHIEWLGRDVTGRFADEALYGSAAPEIFESLTRIVTTRQPHRRISRLDWNDQNWLMMEAVEMPLGDETGDVSMILRGAVFSRARILDGPRLLFEPLPGPS